MAPSWTRNTKPAPTYVKTAKVSPYSEVLMDSTVSLMDDPTALMDGDSNFTRSVKPAPTYTRAAKP